MSSEDRQRGEQIRSMIVDALGHLADPADRQLVYLQGLFGRSVLPADFNVDELALELNDVALAAHLAVAAGGMTAEAASAVARVDEALAAISGTANAPLWTVTALFDALEWERIRGLAAAALALL